MKCIPACSWLDVTDWARRGFGENSCMREQTYAHEQVVTGPFGYFCFLTGHLKLLVLLPLAVGVAAMLLALSWPKSYVSTTLLLIPAESMNSNQVAAIMRSDPILRGMDPSTDPEVSARRVSSRVGRDGMVRVEVSGNTPERAQESGKALIETWLRSTAPGEVEKSDLMARRDRAITDFKNVQAGMDAVTRAMAAREAVSTEAMLSMATLSEAADRIFTTIQATTRRLEGIPRDVIRQAPSLPTKARQPHIALVALASAAVALFALLLVLLLRHRYRSLRAHSAGLSVGDEQRGSA